MKIKNFKFRTGESYVIIDGVLKLVKIRYVNIIDNVVYYLDNNKKEIFNTKCEDLKCYKSEKEFNENVTFENTCQIANFYCDNDGERVTACVDEEGYLCFYNFFMDKENISYERIYPEKIIENRFILDDENKELYLSRDIFINSKGYIKEENGEKIKVGGFKEDLKLNPEQQEILNQIDSLLKKAKELDMEIVYDSSYSQLYAFSNKIYTIEAEGDYEINTNHLTPFENVINCFYSDDNYYKLIKK